MVNILNGLPRGFGNKASGESPSFMRHGAVPYRLEWPNMAETKQQTVKIEGAEEPREKYPRHRHSMLIGDIADFLDQSLRQQQPVALAYLSRQPAIGQLAEPNALERRLLGDGAVVVLVREHGAPQRRLLRLLGLCEKGAIVQAVA